MMFGVTQRMNRILKEKSDINWLVIARRLKSYRCSIWVDELNELTFYNVSAPETDNEFKCVITMQRQQSYSRKTFGFIRNAFIIEDQFGICLID